MGRLDSQVYTPPAPPRTKRIRGSYELVVILAVCLILGCWVATEYVAYGFGFHPNLGPALFVLPSGVHLVFGLAGVLVSGIISALLVLSAFYSRLRPIRRFAVVGFSTSVILYGIYVAPSIYAPQRYVGWALAYGALSQESPYYELFNHGLLSGATAFLLALAVVMVYRKPARVLPSTGSHGTATWGTGEDLATDEGLLIGRKRVGGKAKLLRYDGEGHLITVAPTRSGKGIGGVVPNLLSYPGSVVVTDPKGENYAVTARYREEVLGQEVIALDPLNQLGAYGLRPSVNAFNPMDLIRPDGDDALECASLLADMLVLPSGRKGKEESFWDEEAKALLSGLILYVAVRDPFEAKKEEPAYLGRTFLEVRRLLTLPRDHFKSFMETLLESKDLAGGLVARAAARHLQKDGKERSGVVSTAQSHTHFLDSPRMSGVLDHSSFELSALKTDRLTLYLVLPAHYLDTYARWLRLTVACALHEMARTPGKPANRVLLLLDEFANLGRMDPVIRAVSLLAGYGLSIWMFLQDLSQLKGTYPEKWGTFLANADVLQAFGTNDHDTAEYFSNLTGDTTVHVETAGESLSRSRSKHVSRSTGASQSFSERGRKLLLPDEVRRMPTKEQLLFVRGHRPIRATKLNYLHEMEFYEVNDREMSKLPVWRRHLIKLRLVREPPRLRKPIFDPNPMFRPVVSENRVDSQR